MKKIISTIALSIPVLVWAQNDTFSIKGKVDNADAKAKVYLMYRTAEGSVTDSATIQNGSFVLTGQTASPTMVNLVYDHNGVGLRQLGRTADANRFYVDKGETMITINDSLKDADIQGTKIQQEYEQYEQFISAPDEAMAAINNEYRSATEEQRKDKAFMEELQSRFGKLEDEKKTLQEQFIAKNPDSYFSMVALRDVAGYSMDVAKVEPIYKSLSADVRNSEAGLAFAKQIESAKKTAIGQVAPDFTQNDVDGNPVKLSDFRGQYVLIDFWASWCGPCRAENPNLVAAYNKFKDKNFTVLGVSLDNPGKKDAWLEAIEKDGLTWTQVSDLQGWKNAASTMYGVRAIPQNYLVGPDGKILASNLRGEELHSKLAELLGE